MNNKNKTVSQIFSMKNWLTFSIIAYVSFMIFVAKEQLLPIQIPKVSENIKTFIIFCAYTGPIILLIEFLSFLLNDIINNMANLLILIIKNIHLFFKNIFVKSVKKIVPSKKTNKKSK